MVVMKRVVAIVYTLFAVVSFLLGYFSNSGPLDYIFFVIAGVPWTQILSWLLADRLGGSPVIAFVGVFINLAIVWWWATRKGKAAQ